MLRRAEKPLDSTGPGCFIGLRMNTVPYEEALGELGEYGMLQIAALADWLESGQAETPWRDRLARLAKSWEARIAPSIVARGMADFLGVSYPRFGMRVYLPGGSFVNAIRVGSLCNEVRKWGERDPELPEDKRVGLEPDEVTETPAMRFRKGECVGDCVLTVPERLRSEFKTIARDFGRAYGEGKSIEGIPYAKTTRLSGMCAQAVCFMATALLHDHSTGVFGVPEITRYASDMDRLETLVTGLMPREISHYFERVGLSGVSINLNEWPRTAATERQGAGRTRSPGLLPRGSAMTCFTASARAYLRSGFPVLFRVDAGRMAGYRSPNLPREEDLLRYDESIYKFNGVLPHRRQEHAFKNPRPRGHVVVGVGFSGDEFLIHDPSCLPFMRATGPQLVEASTYLKERDGELPMTELDKFRLIPVTPRKVKLLLADACENSQRRGLLPLAHSLRRDLDHQSGAVSGPFDPGELLLARPSADRGRIIDFIREIFGPEWPEAALLDEWVRLFGDRLIWWQAWREGCEIWLWDAETTGNGEYRSVHIGRVRCRGANHQIDAEYPHPDLAALRVPPAEVAIRLPPEKIPPLTPIPGLRYGMISSFVARGLDSWNGPWPGGYCDLYCFMQRDADRLLKKSPARPTADEIQAYRAAIRRNYWRNRFVPRFHGPWPTQWKLERWPSLGVVEPRCNVFRMLAALPCTRARWHEARDCVKEVADEIRAQLAEFGNPPVEAFSSYFPEASSHSREVREDVAKALSFLMHLAQELNRDRCEAGQFTLEVVAGGLTNGIWPAKPTADDDDGEVQYVMNLRNPSVVVNDFLDTLRRLDPAFQTTKVRISVECEPGPLYLLGTWDRLVQLCSQIETDATLKNYCGLSADLAHWAFLKRVDRTEIPRTILDMIQNVHISDHGDFGHFGDAMPFEVHDRQIFVDWLGVLCSGRERFTGLVSGEFEAALNPEDVREFARRLGIPRGGALPVANAFIPA